MKRTKLDNALNEVSEFIISLGSPEEISPGTGYDLFFSFANEGTLFLSDEEATRYRECLKSLSDAVGDEIISQNAVEKLYQKAILTVLDIQKRREDKPLAIRLEAALEELRNSLTAAPSSFKIYYPVFGIATDGLPIKIGNVTFCIFDNEHLALFIKAVTDFKGNEDEKRKRLSLIEEIKKSEINGKPVGLIEAKAIDDEAAKISALKELSLTVNIINFFSEYIPYQRGHIFLPGDKERLVINVPVISQSPKPNISYEWKIVGPLMPVSLQQLLDTNNKRNLGISKISDLLTRKRNKLEERLISAMQWAGKANTVGSKEEAFLLNAISLESLVLLENDKGELTYRLRTRVAHLLGKDVENRKKISKKVGDLYDIRSQIVHSGSYQVTDADLSLMRLYSKVCIMLILNDERLSSINSVDSLVEWFDEQILK